MVKFIQSFIVAVAIGCLFMPIAAANAYSVAVLPVTDLAHGRKGVNFEVTSQLVEQLRQQGIAVIEPDKVIEFMVQHGLRRCDEIDSFSSRKMAISLNCDSLLLTTLYRHELIEDQSSLILTLLHGKNGRPVWSKIVSAHLDDDQPLFGIKKNRELSALQTRQIHALVRQLIRELPSLPKVTAEDLSPLQVADIYLSQPFTRGESSVHCRLKIEFLESEPDTLLLSGGEQPIKLARTDFPHIYSGIFTSKAEDGEHNLSLSTYWPLEQEKTVTDLISYRVVNRPAKLTLSFLNGFKLGEVQAFSTGIKIIPKMEPRLPLDFWRITMSDEEGNTVFTETKYTDLPKEMYWQGTNNNRRQLDTGYYTLSLTVRDLAGNEAQVTSKLYLQSTKMELVDIRQYIEQGHHKLELLPTETMLIPIDNWTLTLETKDGDTMFTQTGIRLPAIITIPETISQQELFCYFLIKDKLGNQYITANKQLNTSATGILAQTQKQNSWKADF